MKLSKENKACQMEKPLHLKEMKKMRVNMEKVENGFIVRSMKNDEYENETTHVFTSEEEAKKHMEKMMGMKK